MDHGLYTAYLGMRARQRALDVTANNIANASTTGFKADRMLYRSIEETVQSDGTHGISAGVAESTRADHSMGMLRETGRPLDVALDGDGFLVVQTPAGERFTRSGSLKIDDSGQLTTDNGYLVVGDAGPITIPQGEIAIADNGEISANGQAVGRLKIVRFDEPQTALIKEGGTLFAANPAAGAPIPSASTRVVQGALETSNVNPLAEVAALIQNSREFDSLQRSLSMLMNDLGRKIANEIGKI